VLTVKFSEKDSTKNLKLARLGDKESNAETHALSTPSNLDIDFEVFKLKQFAFLLTNQRNIPLIP